MLNLFLSLLENLLIKYLSWLLILVFMNSLQAQINVSNTSAYKSALDQMLTIKSISVLPVTDNIDSIYARPLENHIRDLIDKNHHWDLVKANDSGSLVTGSELESTPQKVIDIANHLKADALLTAHYTKGPQGITLKLDLFLAKDGKLLIQETQRKFKSYDIPTLKNKTSELLATLMSRIPYSGIVLSRTGQRVTVNLGQKDGMERGQIVSVIQILKVNRHPKFNFLINTEKEILGKIKLIKVDGTLSFGRIITEKERGTILADSKISGIDFVNYSSNDESLNLEALGLEGRPDAQISFGKKAQAWKPKKPPLFGQVGAALGLGQINQNMSLPSEELSSSPLYPSIEIDAELWITPSWTVHTRLQQGVVSLSNPRSGSVPKNLSQSIQTHEMLGSYNFRLEDTLWGSKAQFIFGFANYKTTIDNTSPMGFSSLNYSGWKFGLAGDYSVVPDEWLIGAEVFFFLQTNLIETPKNSGSSNNTVNQFAFHIFRKLSPRLKVKGAVNFDLYSSQFSGSTHASSSSHKHSTFTAGIYYMF